MHTRRATIAAHRTGRIARARACGPGPLVCALLLAGSAAWGQPGLAPPGVLAGPEAEAIFDGRTFAGVNLPVPARDHPLTLAAARTWAWKEGTTDRLLLERDVRITIGPYGFSARRASVWLEPIRLGDVDADQVAIYFDEVFDIGSAPIEQSGRRLLVTAILLRSAPSLKTDRLTTTRPAGDEFLIEAEARLSRHLLELTGQRVEPAPGSTAPGQSPLAVPPEPAPTRGQPVDRPSSAALPEWLTMDERGTMPPAERAPAELPRDGVVSFFSPSIEATAPSEGERALVLSGGISVQYTPLNERAGRTPEVHISAERAVVFLAASADQSASRFDVGEVLGIYLEGDVVAGTADYTLRGARVFYDVRTNRATVLEAVFWTYDEQRGMPIYLRAASIRQESLSQWSASNVRLANVGFAEPHFSIGVTDVTITRAPARAEGGVASARTRTDIDASGVTFRFGDTPVAYLPNVRGELKPSVLRRLSFDSEGGNPVIRTGWDLNAILGLDRPPGNDALFLLDGFFDRGVGVGTDLDWRAQDIQGNLFAYYIHDDGTDELPSGSEIDQEDKDRGVVTAEQIWRLSDQWTLFAEGAYISDETFIPAFFRSEAATRREYISSIYARRLEDNTGLTIEARGTFNDFLTNEYLLQSQGYTTEKLPEASYYRLGDDLFGGLLSYSSEYSLSALRLAFNEPTNAEMGFRSISDARAAFGLLPNQSLATELRARGLTEDDVYRADTRQELEAPLRAGQLNIVPFVAGRATAWDDNFDEFNQDDNEPYRLWGSAGIRFHTTIQKVDDSARSEALDIDRIRHIIEPNATIWHSDTTIDQEDLPVYDFDVESISSGSSARVGVRNTLQTYRGAPGLARSADLLIVDSNYVWSSDEVDRESPYGRFIEARPELSNLGEFATNETIFNLTDALSITNGVNYDVDEQSLARLTAGLIIDHGYGFSTLFEYRSLDQPSSQLFDLSARYELTRKYAATFTGTYDQERREFQGLGARLERRFPQWTVDFRFGFDNVTNEVSAGVALRPAGFAGEDRTRVFTRDVSGTPVLRRIVPEREAANFGPFAD